MCAGSGQISCRAALNRVLEMLCCKAESRAQLAEEHSSFPFSKSLDVSY